MPARLSAEQKRAFATEQYEELIKMGLTPRVASELMETVGPALSVETLAWTQNAWEVFENWINDQYRKLAATKGWKIPHAAFHDADEGEVRNSVRSCFFRDYSYLTPKVFDEVSKELQEKGLSEHGLGMPPARKYKKMMKGVNLLLEHFPLKN